MNFVAKFLVMVMLCFSVSASDYIIMDDETETLVRELVYKLKEAMHYDSDIGVFISSNQSLNASAVQSGDIVLNAGAIIQCKNVSELIAILAHEVGHIEGSHIATFLSNRGDFLKAGLVTMLIGAAAAVCANDPTPLLAGAIGGQTITSGMALSKLRQKENIADTKAAQAIKILGWPVFDGFIALHEKLASDSGMYEAYLSTHPQSKDRLTKFRQYFAEEKKREIPDEVKNLMTEYERRFQIVKSKLCALMWPVENVLGQYSKDHGIDGKYAIAIGLYRSNKYDEAVSEVDEILSSSEVGTDLAYYTEIKAMSLIKLKKCKKAADIAFEILKKDRKLTVHRDLGIVFADAVVEGNLNNLADDAIKILKKINIIHRDDPTVLNMLGMVYSMANKSENASLCAAEVAVLLGDKKAAVIHANKASRSADKIIKQKAEDIISSIDLENIDDDTCHP